MERELKRLHEERDAERLHRLTEMAYDKAEHERDDANRQDLAVIEDPESLTQQRKRLGL